MMVLKRFGASSHLSDLPDWSSYHVQLTFKEMEAPHDGAINPLSQSLDPGDQSGAQALNMTLTTKYREGLSQQRVTLGSTGGEVGLWTQDKPLHLPPRQGIPAPPSPTLFSIPMSLPGQLEGRGTSGLCPVPLTAP